MNDEVEVMFLVALVYYSGLYIAAYLSLVCVAYVTSKLRRHCWQWCVWDILVAVLPGGIYAFMDIYFNTPKTLSNLLELVYLGIASGSLFFIKSLLPTVKPATYRSLSLAGLVIITLLTIGVYCMVPALSE